MYARGVHSGNCTSENPWSCGEMFEGSGRTAFIMESDTLLGL